MPPLNDDTTDRLLRALADGTRRGLLDRLRDHPGLTLGELAMGFPQTRQALSKHLAVLEAAGLVVTLWRGREKLHYLDPQPLQALPARWVLPDERQAAAAMQALQAATAPVAASMPGDHADAVLDALAAPAGPGLDGRRIADAAGLEAARAFLAGTAEAVRRLLVGLDEPAARQQPAAGGFSLVQHLWHLADLEQDAWVPRWQRVLTEVKPKLAAFDGDRIAAERNYQALPWRGAGRRFIAERRRSLALLARCSPTQLAQPLRFAGARSDGADLLARMVAHDLEHRQQMAERWIAARPLRSPA